MQQREPHTEFGKTRRSSDGYSHSESSAEGETLQDVPQPPLIVRQAPQQAITIPMSSWRRLQRRIATMPRATGIWMTLAGALAGAALSSHDGGAPWLAAGALLCFLADRAVNKGRRAVRNDILDEMRLHDPSRRRVPKH